MIKVELYALVCTETDEVIRDHYGKRRLKVYEREGTAKAAITLAYYNPKKVRIVKLIAVEE